MLVILAQPRVAATDNPQTGDGLRQAAQALRGDGGRADFAADFIGARAVVHHTDAYPVLGPAMAKIGINWPITTVNPHPPTMFLAALPLSWLSWPVAYAVWAWLMVAALVGTVWALGVSLPKALVVGPLLLCWPPISWSIGQATILWLLCQCLAWRWRDKPLLAGAAIAVAALTKLTPVLLLVPFLLTRRWSALKGFVAVSVAAVIALAVLDFDTLHQYLSVSRSASDATASRLDNGAFLAWLHHSHHATLGVAAGVLLCLAVLLRGPRSHDAWAWLAIAVLPIAWVYSLAPLLTGLLASIRSHRLLAAAAAALGLAFATIAPPFGLSSAGYEAGVVALAGAALVLRPRTTAEVGGPIPTTLGDRDPL